jgi:hypothetical protein
MSHDDKTNSKEEIFWSENIKYYNENFVREKKLYYLAVSRVYTYIDLQVKLRILYSYYRS